MSQLKGPPHSPTLVPPRKSIELEDPGAHELESSDADTDVFADAQEDTYSASRPSSPIPTTRVEKVDDRESHGEVPGTAAYKLRTQDAVPDEVEVVPEGQRRSRSASQAHSSNNSAAPKLVLEKIDSIPSHGEVPGTPAHAKRRVDAVPDEIRSPSHSRQSSQVTSPQPGSPQIPTTVITKVDSKPSHGEVPGTEAFDLRTEDAKPDVIEEKSDVHSEALKEHNTPWGRPSPMAADGGFGFMGPDSDTDDDTSKSPSPVGRAQDQETDAFGDDFDDFEAGEEGDFDDFGEATPIPEAHSRTDSESENDSVPPQPQPIPDIPFPLLDFSELDSFDDILTALEPYNPILFPQTIESLPDPPPALASNTSIFLTDRSHSLWSQLVAPPPLQPPNWVRSRIRRLFLVSLGVPVDLDEILPASKQKKLVLPSINLRSDSPSRANGGRAGSRVRLKQDNASSTSIDKAGTTSAAGKKKGKKSKDVVPELDLQAARMLCATTETALQGMTDEELAKHFLRIKELEVRASEVLEYWLKKRDSALGDKEAFEGVIENLVRHARRVRK